MNSNQTKDGITQAYNDSVRDIPESADHADDVNTKEHPDPSWNSFLKSLKQFSDDFMNDRNQPEHQKR